MLRESRDNAGLSAPHDRRLALRALHEVTSTVPRSQPDDGASRARMKKVSWKSLLFASAPVRRDRQGAYSLIETAGSRSAMSVIRGRITSRLANLPPCLIGIEAGMATHYVARELAVLGHDVKQVPPAYSKPFR